MVENFGGVLRELRSAKNLSQEALATRVYCDQSYIAYLESGRRRPTLDMAVALDEALGTTPLLAVVYEINGLGRDDMRRRGLLTGAAALAGVAVTGSLASAAVADTLHAGLRQTLGEPADWDAIVDGFARQLVIAPTDQLGASLGAQIMVARGQLAANPTDRDTLRGAARLTQLYGLWSGNRGNVTTAGNCYRTAAFMAHRSGDPVVESFVRGRTASRWAYEGARAGDVLTAAERALSLGRPSLGHLEAQSARVHIATLLGNYPGAVQALGDMQRVIDQLPDGERDGAAPTLRLASFANYVHCRVGSAAQAERAYEAASKALPGVPVWWTEAQIYYALSLARAGSTGQAITVARTALTGWDHPVHTIGVAVRDLLSALTGNIDADDLQFLAAHAARGAMPWDTIKV